MFELYEVCEDMVVFLVLCDVMFVVEFCDMVEIFEDEEYWCFGEVGF